MLRVLEHRMQLRICVAPTSCRSTRGPACAGRASGLAETGPAMGAVGGIKREVREIHVRLFYRPLLSAVAALRSDEQQLSRQAHDRLAAIGFRDPAGPSGTSARSPAG
jgi:glutamate-ammonia-ligase adenylyltransferase